MDKRRKKLGAGFLYAVAGVTVLLLYLITGGAMSRLRVVQAGYRLAAVLRQIVD